MWQAESLFHCLRAEYYTWSETCWIKATPAQDEDNTEICDDGSTQDEDNTEICDDGSAQDEDNTGDLRWRLNISTYSAGSDFRRQNLTSSQCKSKNIYNGRKHIKYRYSNEAERAN